VGSFDPIRQIKLRTLTPLWLGDIDRDSGVPKESGLLGSMRFWYEGLLRSCGARACDPTGETQQRCEGSKRCDACKLFGATGYARRFRLEIEGLQPTPVFFRLSRAVASSSGNWLWTIFGGERTGGKKTRGPQGGLEFEFGVRALWSPEPFTINLHARPKEQDRVFSQIAFLLQTVSQKGGIGAKTQYGFGQVKLEPDPEIEALANEGEQYLGEQPTQNPFPDGTFTLHPDRFFTLLYRLPADPYGTATDIGKPPADYDRTYIPCAFDIRYKYESWNPSTGRGSDRGLRPAIRDELGDSAATRVFGFVRGGSAEASRVHVSHLYRETPNGPYLLKIWGDVAQRQDVVSVIREHLKSRFPGIEEPEVL